MSPAIRDGEMVHVRPAVLTSLRPGDVVLVKGDHGFRLHRLVMVDFAKDTFITRGDCGQQDDPPVTGEQIIGIAVAKEVLLGRRKIVVKLNGLGNRLLSCAARGRRITARWLKRTRLLGGRLQDTASFYSLLVFFFLLCAAAFLHGQVAVDTTTSISATVTGAGNHNLTFRHNTANTANRVLLVGVSMNIVEVPTATVTGVTYSGTALTLVGAHNDANNTRRVEMWYLLAPTNGRFNVVVTVDLPSGGSVGVVSGATTFTDVDQTVPLGTFVSADGAASTCTGIGGGCSSLDVPSVVNGMILDTLAVDGTQAVTVSGPQTQEWNRNSGGNTDPGVRGSGSSRTGAPSVPISETFSGTSNWALGAISINPSSADIGVSTSVSAVALGQSSTYTITITNNGPSAANDVILSDTLAASGLTLNSVTPSSGTLCTGSGPINCTLPTPFAGGAVATVTIVVTASAAGFYPNTATITDSGTPPDPNTGNNSYVALAPVVSVVCSTTTLSTPPSPLSGVLNTYYPGTSNVAAGATSIPVGTPTGAANAITAGSLLLVIQMQNASIDTSNNVAYGNGSTGAGFTAINNAGNYEFVKAIGPVSAGFVPISGAGAGGGLVFGYSASGFNVNTGQSTYQVVLVPQYLSATLGAATASPWNGSTGGILALDIAGQLNLGGATVSVDGLGFRGGAGMQLTGGTGSAADYWHTSPTTYTGTAEAGVNASKGEGVAGTPLWVESGGTFLNTGSGYPNGSGSSEGSMARGAPGNGGGGGTDANPGANDQNDGGGGGGNGGSGGFGGDSWNTNLSDGGEGGAVFPATIDRLAMGGGGGAGTRNNSDGDNQASGGATGGGLIFIRADSFTGTATLSANGADAYNGTANDAGGGGGAGGTIVVLAANGGEGGLTLSANGGRGGNAWQSRAFALTQRHGPGGGGGGGVVFVSAAPAAVSVNGGANGLTLNTPAVAYGSTPGNAGSSATNATLSQVTGIQSASLCVPDMTLGKSHIGNFVRGSAASYTIPVSNVSPYGASVGVVTINDTLPIGLTPLSATGFGWTCSASGQTMSCTRSDPLAQMGTYPSITLNAAVSQSAPATVTNIAAVAGGGEANLLNDTASDVANVVSSADLSVTDSGVPNPVSAGSNITYSQIVTNSGPSAADNAILVAPIPANTTFVSMATPAGWSCASPAIGATGNVVCSAVNLLALMTGTFTLVVKVNPAVTNGTVISDSVSVSSAVADPNAANNTASVNTLVGTSGPDLTVTDMASPNPVQATNNITYTQVVTNTGSSAATTATFNETTPTNTSFVSITPPPGWTCFTFPPQCTNPSVGAGASGTFTVIFKVNAGTASGTPITDTVTVNAANQSFGPNSATATDIVATGTQADVTLSTAATPTTVFAGNNITYTQVITNNGPAAATSLSFTEATPTNTTFASVSPPAGWTCTAPAPGATGTVNCTAASLAPGTEADIVVVVNVPASTAAASISANSSVTASTGDPNSSNNSTTVTTPVVVRCDLAVTNSGTPSPVAAGSNITYTQIVSNTGPGNCAAGNLNEATPANTTFVSVAVVNSGGGTWTCPNSAPIACTNPSVAIGSTGTITAVYKVNAGTTAGTVISDTATVTTTSRDTNLSNNSATVQIGVASGTQADLSVTNAGSPNPVSAGGTITYSQSVTNAGPATATTVSFTDPVPANTTAVSLSGPAGWSCSIATVPPSCTIGSLAANTTANFTYVANVNANVTTGTAISETDSVSSATGDPNSGNNSSTVKTLVAGSADLSVTNTPTPVPVIAGNNISYTQSVNNAGPSTATSVTVTDALPANTTAVSLAGPAGWTCSLVSLTCTNPSLASSSPATITFVVKVMAGTAAGTAINDTVNVASAVGDPNPVNNTATANDVVATATQADLVTTNVASPTSVAAGSNVTYTQSVTNHGPAAATGAALSETTPPNTTFQSIIPAAGWTCGTVPAVGSTGTINCTDGSNLAVNGTAIFTVVLQVNPGTPSGTNITDIDTASASNIVPNLTSNTASATIVVANANSADMAIVKSATPNPVTEGTPLTYSLAVANNGPASASNVTVTDTLPSVMTYLSSTATQGSCSEAGATVTCLVGTMANGANATITILAIPGAPGIVSNTATVTADQTDPDSSNNSSTQSETITAPTAVMLQAFSAHSVIDNNGANRIMLTWKTGGEAHNLGFNVYREVAGNHVRLNPSLIAGSALLMTGALPQHAGRSYAWIDPSAATPGGSYWLEDVDVNGIRTMHGPVSGEAGLPPASEAIVADSRTFSQLSQIQAVSGGEESHTVEAKCKAGGGTAYRVRKQFELAARQAVKIYVRHEGWYRIPQADLVKAGLDADVDPTRLHLYAEAIEQPMAVLGALQGAGGFGPSAAIEFYGTAIDTPFSGNRTYWLVAEDGRGARIQHLQSSSGSNQPPHSFPTTVELSQHTTYFAALLTNNGENFFGALVSPTPVDQSLNIVHLDLTSSQISRLDIVLQGVVAGFPHDVKVALNGTPLGDVTFSGQDKGSLQVNVPAGLLEEGNNIVTLTAQNGDYDTSLVQSIRITYPHLYMADSDALKFSGRAGDEVQVAGFTRTPIVLDITDADHPVQLTPQVSLNAGTFDIALQIPWSITGSKVSKPHILLAVGSDRVASAANILSHHPSHWHAAQAGADVALVTFGQFENALHPLVHAHEAEGKSSVLVPVGDLYDEFNFGEPSPFAIRTFLETANASWKKAPSYLLLNGRASFDPRDYLGFGHTDLVPTRILPIGGLMTASDDWFSDFNDSGIPTMATGRLPVATLEDDKTVVGKIVGYEGKSTNVSWTSRALMVADKDDTESFTKDSRSVESQLPASIKATDVFVGVDGTAAARQEIVDAINSGELLVNYLGHGSEEQWSGSDVFNTKTVSSLTNGTQLPVFLIMDCLNGFFQDIYAQPLGVTLLLAPNGGAVAVLASSGLNQPAPQTNLDRFVIENAFGAQKATLGDAIVKAKSKLGDSGVKRTFILFGDPAMRITHP